MRKIFELDKKTIESIAAGEIIARPESIIKETVENSIDANASEITIEIREGGKKYIRVSDDGDGISRDDLKFAFKKHFTSKIKSYEELFSVQTRGFRGEALNSIATVSDVTLISKEKDSHNAYKISVKYGEYNNIEEAVSNTGTTIICENLFQNMPVRKTFLASDRTEENRIIELVQSLAIGYPNIAFQLISNGRFVLNTSGSGELKTSIFEVFGFEIATNLLEIEHIFDDYRIWGYIGSPIIHRPNSNMEILYVNGRVIENNDLKKQINMQYTGKIPNHKKPVYFIFIEMPEHDVDVNYHPTKKVVKFNNYAKVVELLKEVVGLSLNKPQDFVIDSNIDNNVSFVFEESFSDTDDNNKDDYNNTLEQKNVEPSIVSDKYSNDYGCQEQEYDNSDGTDEINGNDFQYEIPEIIVREETQYQADSITLEDILPVDEIWRYNRRIGFVFGDYYLIENKSNSLLIVIDVKAALQKVLYKDYEQSIEEGKLIIQSIIDPYVYKYDLKTIEIMSDLNKEILKFGFDYDIIGDDSLILRGIPSIISESFTMNLFDNLVAIITEGKSITRYVKNNIILGVSIMASRASIYMDETNFINILMDLLKMQNKNISPQGKQIFTIISKTEFQKRLINV